MLNKFAIISKYSIFLILVFFPFVSFGLNKMDTQPWLILFAIIFYRDFFLFKKSFKFITLIMFFVLSIQILALFNVFELNFEYLSRGMASYLIFSLVYSYQQKNLNINFLNHQKIIFSINFIYLIVALIQTIFSPHITRFLVLARTSETRGVTSLTPEPTMFGIFLIFFCLIYLVILNERNKIIIKYFVFFNLVSIIFIAKSATASLYLIIGILLWVIFNLKSFKVFLISISLLPLIYILINLALTSFLNESRLSSIYNSVLNGDVFKLITLDVSIRERILSNIFPFKASFNNLFFPGGFNLDVTFDPIDIVLFDFIIYDFHTGPKIMSLWGSLIAELGFFILFFLGYLIYLIFHSTSLEYSNIRKILFIFSMLFLLGFTSFTISFPLFSFLLASLPILNSKKDMCLIR